jgi:hypothetical protein
VGIFDELASSLGQRGGGPNFRVAASLAHKPDADVVSELVDTLVSGPAPVAGDAAAALQRLAELDPAQVAPHCAAIAGMLASRNNRLVWGAATILHSVAAALPAAVRPHVRPLMRAVTSGSVITQDHGVGALAATGDPAALDFAFAHLRSCGWHYVPLRAERVAPFVGDRWEEFRDAVESRLPEQAPGGARRIRRLLDGTARADAGP